MEEEEKTYPRVVDVPVQTTPMIELADGDVRDMYGCLEHIIKELKQIRKAVA